VKFNRFSLIKSVLIKISDGNKYFLFRKEVLLICRRIIHNLSEVSQTTVFLLEAIPKHDNYNE
jgi:hypothetical protein